MSDTSRRRLVTLTSSTVLAALAGCSGLGDGDDDSMDDESMDDGSMDNETMSDDSMDDGSMNNETMDDSSMDNDG